MPKAPTFFFSVVPPPSGGRSKEVCSGPLTQPPDLKLAHTSFLQRSSDGPEGGHPPVCGGGRHTPHHWGGHPEGGCLVPRGSLRCFAVGPSNDPMVGQPLADPSKLSEFPLKWLPRWMYANASHEEALWAHFFRVHARGARGYLPCLGGDSAVFGLGGRFPALNRGREYARCIICITLHPGTNRRKRR
jgi:hypothetical protein